MFKYYLYQMGLFLVRMLSLKQAYALARFFSDLQYLFSPRDRKIVFKNLRVIFPQKSKKELRAMTKEVFRNFGKYLVEFFRMERYVDKAYIQKSVDLRQLPDLDELLSRYSGAIILTAHIGNWELGGVVLGLLGYKLMAIALPHKERPVNELFNRQRRSKGISVVPTHLAIRRCLETLKNNGIVAVLADRDFSLNGETLDFLGRKAILPKGPAILSVKTGTPIIPLFLVRNEDNTFTMQCEDIILPEPNLPEKERILLVMKKYAAIIEKKIKSYPTQWLMFRPFWIKE